MINWKYNKQNKKYFYQDEGSGWDFTILSQYDGQKFALIRNFDSYLEEHIGSFKKLKSAKQVVELIING